MIFSHGLQGKSQVVQDELVRLGEQMVNSAEGTRALALELCCEFEDKFLLHITSGEVLPVMIDVGTNNDKLLKDPLWFFWRVLLTNSDFMMGRGVSSGGGQSSLGYLFGSGEAPKATTSNVEAAQNPGKVASNEPPQKPTATAPPPAGDVSKQIPAGIPGNNANSYHRADGQNTGNFLTSLKKYRRNSLCNSLQSLLIEEIGEAVRWQLLLGIICWHFIVVRTSLQASTLFKFYIMNVPFQCQCNVVMWNLKRKLMRRLASSLIEWRNTRARKLMRRLASFTLYFFHKRTFS